MLLKYNINNIKHERRLLDVLSYDVVNMDNDSYRLITFKTKTPHNLNVGDIIIFSRNIKVVPTYTEALVFLEKNPNKIVYVNKSSILSDVLYEKGYYWIKNGIIEKMSDSEIDTIFKKYNSSDDKLCVIDTNFSQTTFSISYKRYKELYVNEIFNTTNEGCVKLDNNIPISLNKGDIFYLKKRTHSYQFERTEKWDENIYESDINPENNTTYMGFETVKFLGNIYTWKPTFIIFECKYISDNMLTYSYDDGFISKHEMLEIEDTRFMDSIGDIFQDVLFYEHMEVINVSLPIISKNATELNDENIAQTYFNEKKQELIPEIVDYEKRCFTPFYKSNKNLEYINGIKFNLFFRDRTNNEDWTSNDSMGWFQYQMDKNGNFIINEKITNGDLLGNLNFTDDDVFYRKKKISKSFLRLSFYNSNNPLNQMLLYYSTIFLDSGELYTKYIKNLPNKTKDVSIVKDNKFGDNNLTVNFSVNDRYNRVKSSEGFYIYLFPDGLKNGEERTIYMKAEFNHAGYGKTIPFIYPNNSVKYLSFNDTEFPTSLINESNGNLSEFYRQLYIPITIKYDKSLGNYVYYFNLCQKKDDNIIINLYEPKINPLI